jgi:hypothetical protein
MFIPRVVQNAIIVIDRKVRNIRQPPAYLGKIHDVVVLIQANTHTHSTKMEIDIAAAVVRGFKGEEEMKINEAEISTRMVCAEFHECTSVQLAHADDCKLHEMDVCLNCGILFMPKEDLKEIKESQ